MSSSSSSFSACSFCLYGIQINSLVSIQVVSYIFVSSSGLQHGLQVVSHGEGGLRLGLDLLDSNAVGNLDEGEAVGEVDIEDALRSNVSL